MRHSFSSIRGACWNKSSESLLVVLSVISIQIVKSLLCFLSEKCKFLVFLLFKTVAKFLYFSVWFPAPELHRNPCIAVPFLEERAAFVRSASSIIRRAVVSISDNLLSICCIHLPSFDLVFLELDHIIHLFSVDF